jgi:hypothetical protein
MSPNNDLEAVCSVTEMARRLGLSRSRFYQLLEQGTFPKPDRCHHDGRPFYPLDLQEKCLVIRKTGIGFNGQPVVFNASRKKESDSRANPSSDTYKELANILMSMGVKLTRKEVIEAIKNRYPKGMAKGPIDDAVIRDMFRYLSARCLKSV